MVHIGLFGRRNVGKSSWINLLIGQDLAIVSDRPGTTTDPVRKRVELLGIGPALLIDTAGVDDEGELGSLRVEKSLEMIAHLDFALVLFSENRWEGPEEALLERLQEAELPFLLLHNQSDKTPLDASLTQQLAMRYGVDCLAVSAHDKASRDDFMSLLAAHLPASKNVVPELVEDLVVAGDTVLLITPIDSEAPAGRLILPQVQTLRALLDAETTVSCCQPAQLPDYLRKGFPKPDLVITDSQAFAEVERLIPADWKLTGFSLLMARQKGDFEAYLRGTPQVMELKDDDKILILESCTHQNSCEDIGRVKLPRLLQKFTGKKLHFEFVSGLSPLPADLSAYAMAIQCGGCMVTRRQLLQRLKLLAQAGVAVSNYGMVLAFVHGIFDRATEVFR